MASGACGISARSRVALAILLGALLCLALEGSAWAAGGSRFNPSIGVEPFGTAPNGQQVSLYTLNSGRRMTVRIMTYGAVVQSIDVPDRRGRLADVVLGLPTLADYVKDDLDPGSQGTTYFGAIVGRYANRIAGGRFSLNGVSYQLPINSPPNTLHGGPIGFNTKIWEAVPRATRNAVSLALTTTSADGEEGFPGALTVTVTYTVTAGNELRISYSARTSKPTVLNLTNHSYFNLAGEGSGTVESQRLMINARSYTPINANLIPTGQISPVAGTPLDFRRARRIGSRLRSRFPQMLTAHGYDFNWVLSRPRPGISFAARAEDPASGRILTAYTDQPGIQVYTGNFLNGSLAGVSGTAYRQTDAFTLETQHFPDSPNQPSFPTTTLNPGQQFTSTTAYRFSVRGR